MLKYIMLYVLFSIVFEGLDGDITTIAAHNKEKISWMISTLSLKFIGINIT